MTDKNDWQPIETAPRDGTHFLAWREHDENIAECWFTGDRLGGRGWHYARWSYPTHWMPKPEPPKS